MPQLVTSFVLFVVLAGIEVSCSGQHPKSLLDNILICQDYLHHEKYSDAMDINFPKDYKMNVIPLRKLRDEKKNAIICNVVLSMHERQENLYHLLGQLHEKHPVYSFIQTSTNSLHNVLRHLKLDGDYAVTGMREGLEKKTPLLLIIELRKIINTLAASMKLINLDEWNCSDHSQFHNSVSVLPTSVDAQPATAPTTPTTAPTTTYSSPQTSAAAPHPQSTVSSVTEPFYIHVDADTTATATPNSDADAHHTFSEYAASTTNKDGHAASTPASEGSVGNTIEETTKDADEVPSTMVSITFAEKKRSLKLCPTKKTIPNHHMIGKRATRKQSLGGGAAQTPQGNPQGFTSTAHRLRLASWGLVFVLLSSVLSNLA
uniref:uncharacterized protein n=1 Tax=Myxine glutinosa TaxID=7769 RepID=UPI00358DFB98